jgi:hypothetical protein
MQNQNLKRRISKAEDKCGISGDDEIVEIPLDDGQIYRSTRRQLNEFIEWLKDRESLNETERNRTIWGQNYDRKSKTDN